MTRVELLEDMLEFGLALETAERVVDELLPLFNDPRGLRAAFVEALPAEAERRGHGRRQ